MGFSQCYTRYPVRHYSRKIDSRVLSVLAGIAQSAKFSNRYRLLQHLKEVEEPFEKNQIGSSAMAYKRNPMRSERIASLANYVMSDMMNRCLCASTQWFERTLDDSRTSVSPFRKDSLRSTVFWNLYLNVVDGLVVYPKVNLRSILMAELPLWRPRISMMDAVKPAETDRNS